MPIAEARAMRLRAADAMGADMMRNESGKRWFPALLLMLGMGLAACSTSAPPCTPGKIETSAAQATSISLVPIDLSLAAYAAATRAAASLRNRGAAESAAA